MPWSTTIPQYHLSTGLEPSPEQKKGMKTDHGPNSHSREYPVSPPSNQIKLSTEKEKINRDMKQGGSKRDMTNRRRGERGLGYSTYGGEVPVRGTNNVSE
jgi:hypothetical protein